MAATHAEASEQERYAQGEALLRSSNATLGWDLYDLHPSRPVDRIPGVQRWDGKPCRLLVVVAEQGFGDAIQFIRFIPQITARATEIIVAVHDELYEVLALSPLLRDVTVISKSEAARITWPEEARWERLMSLPSKIDEIRIKAAGQYLHTNDSGLQLPWPKDMITVGVAWRSTIRHGFPSRSFPARLVPRVAVSERIKMVTLHRPSDIAKLPRGVHSVQISNFRETAEVISQCDFVVTADTVTAHLAPALGIPTFICLRHQADWRWGTPSNPTHWYQSAELLFQDPSETWLPVLHRAGLRIAESIDRLPRARP
jgi:hypothetical protein